MQQKNVYNTRVMIKSKSLLVDLIRDEESALRYIYKKNRQIIGLSFKGLSPFSTFITVEMEDCCSKGQSNKCYPKIRLEVYSHALICPCDGWLIAFSLII